MPRALRRPCRPRPAGPAVGPVLAAALLAACTGPAADAPEAGGAGRPAAVEVTGVLTDEGVECPALRGEDGELYTLAGGDLGGLRPGDRVRVVGTVARMSFCMQGTTLAVERIEAR